MKQLLLSFFLLVSTFVYTQSCSVNTTALDTYIAPDTWGVMPYTTDNLPPAKINVEYDTFISFKLPLYADELDSTLPHIQLATLELQNILGYFIYKEKWEKLDEELYNKLSKKHKGLLKPIVESNKSILSKIIEKILHLKILIKNKLIELRIS